MSKSANELFRMMIVEDESDLREIVSLIIGETINSEFIEFDHAQTAIEYLKSKKPVDIILSDYNMPKGNGGILEKYVRENHPDIPFVLMTSDERVSHRHLLEGGNRAYIQKPYRSKDLQDTVKVLLLKTRDVVFAEQQYVPVSTSTLQRVKHLSCPVFIRLGNDHFVKVLNASTDFDEAVLGRLQVKGLTHLFVEKSELNNLLGDFKERILSKMYLSSMKERPREALALSKGTKELLNVAAKSMAWSKTVMELGNDNVRMVQNIVAADQDIKKVFDWFDDPGSHELGIGSGFFMTYLLVALVEKLEVRDPMAVEKLTLAAFFHDIALDEYHIQNQVRFINAIRLGGATSKESREVIRSHPEKAKSLLSDWESCDVDVLRIIEEHHELPDGTGFPKGLRENQLHPLSKIFILASEVNELFHKVKSREALLAELIAKADQYAYGEIQKIYSVMLGSL